MPSIMMKNSIFQLWRSVVVLLLCVELLHVNVVLHVLISAATMMLVSAFFFTSLVGGLGDIGRIEVERQAKEFKVYYYENIL